MQHVDKIIDHTALATHDQIKIAQTYIKVDDYSFVASQCKSRGEICARGRLPDATFTGGDNDNLIHPRLPLTPYLLKVYRL